MKSFTRLSRPKVGLAFDPPKIKFNWYTLLPPLVIFLINLFLIWPFFFEGDSDLSKFVILLAYTLAPVSFYFFLWEITGRRLTSFWGSLIYSLPTFRLQQALIFDDSAHVVALSLIPLGLIYLLRFLRRPAFNPAVITSFLIAAVAITSPFSLFTLLIFLATLLYSEMLLGQGRLKLFYTLLVLSLAAGLSAFRYHPEYILRLLLADHGQAVLLILWNLVPVSFFLIPIFGAFSFLIFDRRPSLQALFLAGSQSLVFLLLFFVGTNVNPAYVPMPSRLLPEVSFSLAFLLSLVLVRVLELFKNAQFLAKLKISPKISSNLASFFFIFVGVFLLTSVLILRETFWSLANKPWIAEIRLNGFGNQASHFFGLGVAILTIFALGILKIRLTKAA